MNTETENKYIYIYKRIKYIVTCRRIARIGDSATAVARKHTTREHPKIEETFSVQSVLGLYNEN